MFHIPDVRISMACDQLRAMSLSIEELRDLYERMAAKRFDRASYATIAIAADTLIREGL